MGAERRSMVGTGDRSEKIRTYNFPQNRVTDHRIGLTLHQLDFVMEGKLDEIFDALTTYYQSEKLKQQGDQARARCTLTLPAHDAPARRSCRAPQLLEEAGVAVPRLTAEVLLAHALHRDRVYLYAHPEQELAEVEWLHYGRYLHERLQGKPTQYITKRQEFYGREFRVTPDVLIPRPETEHVVETSPCALARDAARMLDVGTGSGALAVTLQLETGAGAGNRHLAPRPPRVARDNAARLGAPGQRRRMRPDGRHRRPPRWT